MCRIAGIFDPSSVDLARNIITMRDAMHRGGPDDEGVYIDNNLPLALGHRRLSLLDLSSAGHQPMQDLEGDLQIIFNGEIYNFLELKNVLVAHDHIFKTTCDTEVILKAYLQWGKHCFSRFNGMFALAIYDRRTAQLILARDHAGIKPLYYSLTGNKLFFASEIRAFTAVHPGWPENEKWKIYFLTFGHLPEPVTTLANVVALQKGTMLIIDLPQLTTKKEEFSRFVFSRSIATLSDAVAEVKEKLVAAVDIHLLSDAPIGLFLSGGIDSSLLTLLSYPKLKDHLQTISIVFEDEKFSEAKYQKIIIDKTGAKHSSHVVKEEEFFHSLPDILNAMDQPSIDGINSYFICKYAHESGLKAVLSGIGADEMFGGYDSFNQTQKVNVLKKLPSPLFLLAEGFRDYKKKKLSFLQRKDGLSNYLMYRGLYTHRQVASILDCKVSDVDKAISRLEVPAGNSFTDSRNSVSWNEQNLYMQNQLLKDSDYMSMWFGLEVRVPFLDKVLMETVHSIAPEVKYNPLMKKHLLIKAFKDILPKEIYQRKKQGFVFPFAKWIYPVQTAEQRNPKFRQKFYQLKSGQLQWAGYWAYLLTCHKNTIRCYVRPLKRILFLNLKAFSLTGGIEKFNRAFLKALSDHEKDGFLLADGWSMYDNATDEKYFSPANYKGFNGKSFIFVTEVVKAAQQYDTIILGHINLSLIGFVIKKLFPGKEIVLITHGIEIWEKLSGVKNFLVRNADKILAVSNYTKSVIEAVHKVNPAKITVFHNTIDPYFKYPKDFEKPQYLRDRYRLKEDNPVIFTLTRLSYSEKYKGYDKVMEVMPQLTTLFPGIKYLLSGKADSQESIRLDKLSELNHQKENTVLTGFVKNEEVTDHYLLADVFILPSKKEGFGIVFIEAMACGIPVIGGNKDGSVDALQQGELGYLIDPDDEKEIFNALNSILMVRNAIAKNEIKKELQQKVVKAFGFETYKLNLLKVLE